LFPGAGELLLQLLQAVPQHVDLFFGFLIHIRLAGKSLARSLFEGLSRVPSRGQVRMAGG
jgi:hypothetical protein